MNEDRVAIISGGRSHTYGDLDRASRQVASALLQSADDLHEARVAFLVTPGFAYAAVQRGIWHAGGVAVPLAVSHPPPELDYAIRDAGAACLIADDAFAATLVPLGAAAGARCLRVGEALDAPPRRELPHLGPTRRAMIVYTSGTTARPKGVVTTHAILGAEVSAMIEAWDWRPSDHLLLTLPLHHAHGIVNGLLSACAVSATCEILPAFDAATVWARLGSGEITVFTAVPTIYHRLLAAWDAAEPDVRRAWSDGARRTRLMMCGSAALPVQTLARWREITGQTLLERYGMTETGMILSNPLRGKRRAGSVGTPMPDVEVRLVDESGRLVPEGTPGEIEVRGPLVFLEYWGRPADTQAAFRDGWFRTGDTAVLEHGMYRLLGRTSIDIIKTGGYKVSALEIEEVLRLHPAIEECAVVGVADEEWGERVVAAIELRPRAALSLDELQQWARDRLAPYKVPRAMRTVSALPRNAVGKVLKPDVAALFAA
ncbi:MAG: AMP-binding protein [Acidobacteria bacterium]|nr:AMP-binding protein [Acidobacteriota bacterium]